MIAGSFRRQMSGVLLSRRRLWQTGYRATPRSRMMIPISLQSPYPTRVPSSGRPEAKWHLKSRRIADTSHGLLRTSLFLNKRNKVVGYVIAVTIDALEEVKRRRQTLNECIHVSMYSDGADNKRRAVSIECIRDVSVKNRLLPFHLLFSIVKGQTGTG